MSDGVVRILLLGMFGGGVGVPIGSALTAGTQLYYESAGTVQQPWVYLAVEVVERPEFERCVIVTQQGRPPQESCLRGDTLFEPSGTGFRAARPIGPNMRLEVRGRTQASEFLTGEMAEREVEGAGFVEYLPTTVVTRTVEGVITRRLREEYSPAYLTALHGIFEQPDTLGGWTVVQEFELSAVRP